MNFVKTLVASAAVAALAGLSTVARAEDDVRLRLNWMYYGSHAGFAYGKDKGFYKANGINLDIRSGNGSGSANRLVANGDSQFAYGSCGSLVTLASQGAPLISVAVIDAMGTDAVLARPDSGVKTVKDLKGKTILTTANAGVNTFFPIVLKNAGLTMDDIKLVNVAEGALVSSYLQGAGGAVAMLGGLDDKPAEIKAAGGPAPIGFAYSDYGVNQIGYCISTTKDLVKNNPDLVKRFVARHGEVLCRDLEKPRRRHRLDGRHRRRHDEPGRQQGAGARRARRHARRAVLRRQQRQEARPERPLRLGRHDRADEEI